MEIFIVSLYGGVKDAERGDEKKRKEDMGSAEPWRN